MAVTSEEEEAAAADGGENVVGLHRPGSIARIKLHNFLTHGDVEFWPGPRLNMVIGANGTGKSTLLNAICLGLGGDPKLLGRADDLRAFIMHGKDKASIEIELAPHPNRETHILRRTIDKHRGSEKGRGRGASTFYINDEKANVQAVRELVSGTYNIQIDNLCTFLPQDKVGNFSGFSDQDRLLETEKTLPSNQYFYKVHKELIEKEAAMEDEVDNVQSIRDTLKNKKHEFDRLEIGKRNEEERANAEANVDLLKKKRLWLEFEVLRSEGNDIKELKNELKAKVKEANEQIAPLQQKQQALESIKKELTVQSKSVNDLKNKAQKGLDKQNEKYDTHDDQIENRLNDLVLMDEERRKAEEAVQEQEKKVEDLLEQQRHHPVRAEVEKSLREAKENLKAAKKAYESAKRSARADQHRFQELDETAGELQSKLVKLNDDAKQRRERVFRQNKNLGKVAKWLSENRDKFRRPVWGPIAVEVETRSQNTAAYLEFHVPVNILKSIVTETEEDRNLVYSEVREKLHIPVNVISVEGKQLDQRRIYSDQKMQILKREHGVQCYLDETFTAPDPVMIALQTWASVHKVLVGDEIAQKSIDQHGLKDFLAEPDAALGQHGLQRSCIFTAEGQKSYRHTTTTSSYSGKLGTKLDDVGPARMLAPGVDPAKKKLVEEKLKAAHDEINQIRPSLRQAEENMKELESQAQQCNTEVHSQKQEMDSLVKFQGRLDRHQRKLEELRALVGEDDEGKKKEMVSEILNRLKNSIAAISAHGQQHDIIIQHVATDAGITVNRTAANNAERIARQALEEKQEAFAKLKEDAQRATQRFNEIKAKIKKKKKEADELAPLHDENGEPTPLKAQLEDLEVNVIHEVEAALEEAERVLNQYDANPEVIRQYEKLKAEIEKIEDQLEHSTESRERNLQAIDEMRKDWEKRLERHIVEINNLFAVYMEEMGCTGEVRLSKGPKDDEGSNKRSNFKLWGIEILVSFRDGAKAQILSAQRHSGGERSVSTILYLMALQDMMVAPFRCVDEINQGLDDRNERLVFRRIVSNSTRKPGKSLTDHAGQYWLITPKLLPNLTDMEVDGMTILFVTNGPGNFGSNREYNDWLGKGSDNHALLEASEEEDENSNENVPRRKKKKSRLS